MRGVAGGRRECGGGGAGVSAWREQRVFFLDFEGSVGSGILEFGVVTVEGGEITAARTRLCAARGDVRREDTAVHGLDAARVAGAAPFSAEWDYFAGLREAGPLAAHYAGAENALLKAVWPYPRRSPDFSRPGQSVIEWGPWLDSARLYRNFFPSAASGRLEEVVRATGGQAELDALAAAHCPADRRHYHAALYDALAGALLLRTLARDPETGRLTMMQMLALSTLDAAKREALQQGELFT